MGVFKMTKGLCKDYEKLIRDFWWGDELDQENPLGCLENITRPKCKGGLGFRDMKLFNQAMLARLAWRLIQKPTSLCARVLKAKYFPQGNLLDTVLARDLSPVW
jgi:hypothetical protein